MTENTNKNGQQLETRGIVGDSQTLSNYEIPPKKPLPSAEQAPSTAQGKNNSK